MEDSGMSREGLSMAGLAKKRISIVEKARSDEALAEAEEFMAAHEERPEELRLLEALLFAASEPLDEKVLAARMPEGVDVRAVLRRLQAEYAPRGVNLVHIEIGKRRVGKEC